MGVGACRSVLDSKRTEEYALDGIEAFRGRPIEEDYELVKSIGESRSKQEEDRIISREASLLKVKFTERNLPEKKMKELLIRAIYVEMLGHDASFAHIYAVNLT